MITYPTLPPQVRVLNQFGRALAGLGVRVARFEPAALCEIARRKAGLHDFAEDPLFRDGLAVLCQSIEDDASLTLAGRIAIRDYVVHALVNRLRYVEARAREPEVEAVELEPPIIVIGLPRSGTTLLHQLLAQDPRARSLQFWEVMEPIPGPGRDRRREDLARTVANIKRMDRGIDRKHHFGVDNPEECMLLLDATLASLSFWVFAPVHGYLRWLQAQDLRDAYQVYRWYLQRFARDNPGRRLVLKAPAHTAAIEALLQAIPNARLVQIHRDPVEVVPSLHSLIVSLHAMVADPVDLPRMTENNMTQIEHLLATTARARAAGHSWVEVEYTDLVADPLACVRGIYQQLELDFDEGLAEALAGFAAARPKDKYGRHQYCAEDFGATPASLRRRFAPTSAD